MPKKKIQGFWFFAYNWRLEQAKKGKQFSLEEAQALCDPIWKGMSEDEKNRYKTMAKSQTVESKPAERYTSQGYSFSSVEEKQKEIEKKRRAKDITILEILDSAFKSNTLPTQTFNLISFNYFCTWKNKYYPAEVAIVRFSLENGVEEKFHMFLNPGKLPAGTAYEAKELSETIHHLPPPPDALGSFDDNYKCIETILKFVGRRGKRMPLFTATKDISMVENILDNFMDEAGYEENLMVCSTANLLYHMKSATKKFDLDEKGYDTVGVAQILMDRDNYQYAKGLACEFHEKETNVNHCTLHRVVRWGYLLADQCAIDLAIDLRSGTHVPGDSDVTCVPSLGSYYDSESVIETESIVSNMTLSTVTNPGWNYGNSKEKTAQRNAELDTHLYKIGENNPFKDDIAALGPQRDLSNFQVVEKKGQRQNPWSRASKMTSRDDDDTNSSIVFSMTHENYPVLKAKGRGVLLDHSVKNRSLDTSRGRGRPFME